MREMALPPMVTGTVTGATTCVPEATASDPLVTACTPSPPLDAGADWVVASVVVLSPTTEIAFPPTVTGTDTEMIPCVPDSRPPAPEVVADELVAVGCAGGALVVAPLLSASPSSESALPATVTGRSTSISAWVPDPMPSSPLVSAACAATVPRSEIPPPMSTPRSARLMFLCMSFS